MPQQLRHTLLDSACAGFIYGAVCAFTAGDIARPFRLLLLMAAYGTGTGFVIAIIRDAYLIPLRLCVTGFPLVLHFFSVTLLIFGNEISTKAT